MTMPTSLPFGIRDLKIVPYTTMAATILAASLIDLPYIASLSFTESEDFEDLRGDDQLITSHGSGAWVEWEFEAGGISLEAYVAMNGGILTVSGTGPTLQKTYRKMVTDVKPWFAIIGQSISDSGGDLHCIIYRAKVTDNLEGSFEDESFFMTKGKGKGFGSWRLDPEDEYGTLYDFVSNAQITAIVIPPVDIP